MGLLYNDYVDDWRSRNLHPSADQQQILDKIKDHSPENTYRLYPARVVLNTGEVLPTALIELHSGPPPEWWFNKKEPWYYFDSIKEIVPSEYTYNYKIAKEILSAKTDLVSVVDNATKKIYSFQRHAGVFVPEELKGKELALFHSNRKVENDLIYYLPADRGGPDIWSLTPPPKSALIWGNFISG